MSMHKNHGDFKSSQSLSSTRRVKSKMTKSCCCSILPSASSSWFSGLLLTRISQGIYLSVLTWVSCLYPINAPGKCPVLGNSFHCLPITKSLPPNTKYAWLCLITNNQILFNARQKQLKHKFLHFQFSLFINGTISLHFSLKVIVKKLNTLGIIVIIKSYTEKPMILGVGICFS